MPVNLDLPADAERKLRQKAAESGMSVDDYVSLLVTRRLEEMRSQQEVTSSGGGDTLTATHGETT